jgi:prepilin signal peptidase PulO-like enzyme (type II secretory pathway)
MIFLCALVGLLVGSLLNWAGGYLPRFASNSAAPSLESPGRPVPALSPVACTEPSAALSLSKGRSEGPAPWHLLTPGRNSTRLQRWHWLEIAVELFTALLFAYLWQRFGPSWKLLLLASCCSFLLLIAVIDLRYRLVLNVLIYPAAAVTLLFHSVPSGRDALTALLGGAVGLSFFSLVALVRRGDMGAGDVKLAALIGLMVGFPQVLWALTLGILAGGITALFLLLTHLRDLKSYMPYAPFLCLGAAITLIYTPPLPIPSL